MTYYYAPYVDEYVGFSEVRRSETLKNALKGLRNQMSKRRCEAGAIFNTPDIPERPTIRTKNLVGFVYTGIGKKTTIKFNGKKVPTYEDVYYYVPKKGNALGKKIMSDGSLRAKE